jgi:tetratricopeptide (TPR) repeat protein
LDAALLRTLELSAEADAPLLELLGLVETKLGPEDRLAQEVMFAQASSKLAAKDLDAATRDIAMKSAREAFKRRFGGFGPSDPATLALAHRLALLLSRHGERDEAEAMLRQTLADWPASVSALDPKRFAATLDLADLLLAQSKFAPAEAWLAETLETLQKAIPSELHGSSWRLAEVRSRLGAALSEQGRFAAAEPFLIDSRATLEAAWWPEHPRVRAAADRVARHQQRKADDKASKGSP